MFRRLCANLLRRFGWSAHVTVPYRERCVICVAPHTSNWDFILGELYYASEGYRANFLMKSEWFFWPLGPLFRHIGGIPVKRSRSTSLTDQLADAAARAEHFHLAVTPEGTRRLTKTWKHGFYFIALKAQIPIHLYAIDGVSRQIVCTRELLPSGDLEADMQIVREYYRPYLGREIKKGKFALEEPLQSSEHK